MEVKKVAVAREASIRWVVFQELALREAKFHST